MKKKIVMFFIFTFILCSCGIVYTPTPVILTLNSTLSTNNPTHEPLPSETWQPTQTEIPASAHLSYKNVIETQTAGFPAVCLNIRSTSLSPTKNWIAIHCKGPSVQTFEIENKSGKHWTLFLNDYLDKDIVAKYGYLDWGGFSSHSWLKEDEFLLFSAFDGIDRGGTCYYGPGIGTLYKLDLNSGDVAPFLLNSRGNAAYFYDISPDRTMFVYYDQGLVIYNIVTGVKTKIPFDTLAGFGDFTWSSDDKQLAFSTCLPDENDHLVKSTIEIFSLESNTIKQVLSIEGEHLNLVYSIDNSLLEISSSYEKYTFYYDWATSSFVNNPENE